MTTKDGSGSQDNQGSDKLIMGKYKTQEEAFAALEHLEKTNNDLKEALDREQRLNQLLDSAKEPEPRPTQSTSDYSAEYSDLFEDEGKSKRLKSLLDTHEQNIMHKVGTALERKLEIMEARRQANIQFYKKYPELEPFKDQVDMEAQRLGEELGPKSKHASFDSLAKEIASRVKTNLAETKKKLNTSSLLHVEGGSSSEPSQNVGSKDAEVSSETDRLEKYMKDEVAEKNKKRNMAFMPVR